jgi:hypothetical protein
MFTLIYKSKMNKKEIINKFTKALVSEKKRKNKVTTAGITSTMILASLNLAFINESCKSSGQLSKSQVLYRKLDDIAKEKMQELFKNNTISFLKILKSFSRNRKFIISFDTTKEAFYGDFSKAVDSIYLHQGSIAKESFFYYEFLTASITCNCQEKYILDAVILRCGDIIPDIVSKIVGWIKEKILIDVILFDRGFNSKELIYELNKLKVPYMIFWKKQGDWYLPHLKSLADGEFKLVRKKTKFYKNKFSYVVDLKFVFIKQLKYEDKKYDWIFVTNISLKTAEGYIKRYKKRWGIETIYRVTDDIRAYTTSTKHIVRYFLFLFTCLVYNIWKYFQHFMGSKLTLANFKTNLIILMTKLGKIYPKNYDEFEEIALQKDFILLT